ncbi:tyrosine-type recombinase/integrase [Amycolatopsis sp. NPDC006131]|uniref:site-specific integrase n=1 Tax=Amycolatopsis sp. NPDC006131 TaxID=3156731 RepID=UPI00339E75E5
MAWGERLPNGKTYRGCYRDSDGKKQFVRDLHGKVVHYDRKTDAKLAAQELEVAARRRAAPSEVPENAKVTWGEWWESLQEERDNPETDTAAKERFAAEKHIIPRWGDVPLNQIKNRDIQRWVDSRSGLKVRPGMSPAYARRIYAIFRVAINLAVKEGVLTASPCVGVSLPKVLRKDKKFYTDESFDGLKLSEEFADIVEFTKQTGLRPGEIAGLHADHVDRKRGWVDVSMVYVSKRKVIRPYPKDGDARKVPLTKKALEILDRRLNGRDLTGGCGIPHSDGSRCRSSLVFLTPRGNIATPMNVQEALWRAYNQAGKEPPGGLYAGRRGFATSAADGGIDVFTLAELMGHADINQTREYVQQSTATRAKLMAALGEKPTLELVGGADGAEPGAEPGETDSARTATGGA